MRTGFAEALLRESFLALKRIRAERRKAFGVEPDHSLEKMLIVAPDHATARYYLKVVRSWLPERHATTVAQMATSCSPRAQETLAAFRLRQEPSIPSIVAMAHEGLDAPSVAVVAALTHVRSWAWLEQMVARSTRVDPNAGPYETQRALVFHPDDHLFAKFRRRMEEEQGTAAHKPRERKGKPSCPVAA